jgi:hypothetical protein
MKILYIIILSLVYTILNAQTFEWAQKFGTNVGPEKISLVTQDNASNYYIAGNLKGTFFNPIPCDHVAYFGNATNTINGADDIFIAKYNSNGIIQWIKTIGGNYDWNPNSSNILMKEEVLSSLIFDSVSNALYFSGSVAGLCSIDTFNISQNYDSYSSVFGKLDLDGNIIWAKYLGSSSLEYHLKVLLDQNEILLYGRLYQNMNLDGNSIGPGGFIAKYNSQGICQSAQTITTNCSLNELIKVHNKYYIIGDFMNSNYLKFLNDSVTFSSTKSGFIIGCLDNSYHENWLKFGSSNGWSTSIWNLISNKQNKLFFLVGQSDTINFNQNNIIGINAPVAFQIDTNGNLLELNYSVAKSTNKIKCFGDYYFSIGGSTNTDTLNGIAYPTITNQDLFLAQFDSNLVCTNYIRYGKGSADDFLVNDKDQMIIGGIIGEPNTDCVNCTSTLNLGNISLTSAGSTDGFIAKFNGFNSGIDDRSRKSKNINESLLIYANPSNGKCDIEIPDEFLHEKELKLSIYSSTGLLIQQATVNMNEETIKVDIQQEAKGIYNATLSNGKKVYQGRIVFE